MARFELWLEENLFELHELLDAKIWKPDPYRISIVMDPKKRTIHAASVRDRVLYQAIYQKLYSIFDKTFIYDSYASRRLKGTHKGLERFEIFAKKVTSNHTRHAYVLKCDIRKFFDTINHAILTSIIKRKVKDENLVNLIKQVIGSFSTKSGIGLPLGNVTSQIFSNIYLNELDQFVKHSLKEKYYIRYCDDFVILHASKQHLENCICKIAEFLRANLKLELHPKKVVIEKIHNGIDFLGYVNLPHHRVLRTTTKRRILRKVEQLAIQVKKGVVTQEHFDQSLESYKGMLTHCKSEKIKEQIAKITASAIVLSMLLIDGRKTREELLPGLIGRIKKLSKSPTLVIIQVGDRPDSASFIKAKKAFAKKIGVGERHIQLPEKILQEKLMHIIHECNADEAIQGIIVQLPLPEHIDRDEVIEAIDPEKDADGLTVSNIESGRIIPATARGIKELLAHYKIGISGKKVAVVGRSKLVGTPIAAMCKREGAEVTVCHRGTSDLAKETRSADIIICAAGKEKLITSEHVKTGQVVIDVGINRNGEQKLVGDVDFDAVKDIVLAITPVPGGVGPMTVFSLFENLVDLCKN